MMIIVILLTGAMRRHKPGVSFHDPQKATNTTSLDDKSNTVPETDADHDPKVSNSLIELNCSLPELIVCVKRTKNFQGILIIDNTDHFNGVINEINKIIGNSDTEEQKIRKQFDIQANVAITILLQTAYSDIAIGSSEVTS